MARARGRKLGEARAGEEKGARREARTAAVVLPLAPGGGAGQSGAAEPGTLTTIGWVEGSAVTLVVVHVGGAAAGAAAAGDGEGKDAFIVWLSRAGGGAAARVGVVAALCVGGPLERQRARFLSRSMQEDAGQEHRFARARVAGMISVCVCRRETGRRKKEREQRLRWCRSCCCFRAVARSPKALQKE